MKLEILTGSEVLSKCNTLELFKEFDEKIKQEMSFTNYKSLTRYIQPIRALLDICRQ